MREIREAGGELFIVGSGAPHFAAAFREEMELGDVTILTDESLQSYALAGWTRSIFAMLSPRSASNYLRARRSGFKQSKKAGSDLQQGGVLIVRPDGEIAYRFQSRSTGDHPPAKEVVAALVSAIT